MAHGRSTARRHTGPARPARLATREPRDHLPPFRRPVPGPWGSSVHRRDAPGPCPRGVAEASIGLVMGAAAVSRSRQPARRPPGGHVRGPAPVPRRRHPYLSASGVLLLPAVDPAGSLVPFVRAGCCRAPASPRCSRPPCRSYPAVVPAHVARGPPIAGAAQNLTLGLTPPLSIAILDATSLDGVATAAVGVVVAGLPLGQRLPLRPAAPSRRPPPPPAAASGSRSVATDVAPADHRHLRRPLGRRLPPTCRPSRGGRRRIGLDFAADGLAIFLMRFPTGWSGRSRFPARALILAGAG